MRLRNRLRLRAHRARLAAGRLLRLLARGELAGASRLVATRLAGLGRSRNPYAGADPETLEAWHRARASESREFDLSRGVDTAGMVFVEDMDVDHPHFLRAGNYAPTRPSTFNAILSELRSEVPMETMTFVDYGSGKGRALLLASEFPFRRVVGVEFALDLCELARDNVARYRSDTQRCTDIEVIHGDAIEVEPPGDPLFVYLYSPFDEVLLQALLARLEASWRSSPREMVVLLVTPVVPCAVGAVEEPSRRARRIREQLGGTSFLHPVRAGAYPGEEFAVYRSSADRDRPDPPGGSDG